MNENQKLVLLGLGYFAACAAAFACAYLGKNSGLIGAVAIVYWLTSRELGPLADADKARMKRERGER